MLGLYKIMYLKIYFVLLTISDVANDPEPKNNSNVKLSQVYIHAFLITQAHFPLPLINRMFTLVQLN